jgi:hypothetical protein
MKLRRGGRNVQARSQAVTGSLGESSRIERTWRGRWWSGGCSPREEECGRGRDVGGEVVLEGGDE